VLERWVEYPGPRATFRRVIFRILRDPQAALMALLKGEIDETRLSPAEFASEVQNPEFARVAVAGKADQWQINYVGWNMNGANPFFADSRVRRAMSHALDVNAVLRNVYAGLYSPAVGIYPPGSWMFNPEVKPPAHDPRKAGELLDAAGWKLDPVSGWRAKDGVTFAFEMLVPQESSTGRQVLTYYQQGLRALGVEMKLRPVEFATLRELRSRHEFTAFYGAWTTSDDPDQDRAMWEAIAAEGGANYVGYRNDRVDALFVEAGRSFDAERRRECYREIHKLIQDDQPFTFISITPTLWAFNKHLRGVGFSPRGIFFWHPGPRAWWIRRGDVLRP
jgi:peptide/nickel transport system substrate-binding protein